MHSTLRRSQTLHRLAGQPGFRSRISYSDAEYFTLSEKDTRIAKAHREAPAPTVNQVEQVFRTMPTGTDLERRNRALVAFTLLTGARDRAIASLKLKHISCKERRVVQDAREVKTKFSKTFSTWFFPIGDLAYTIVEGWVDELQTLHLWGPNDPLFPATRMVQGENREFRAAGIERAHWSTATPIRTIFKRGLKLQGCRMQILTRSGRLFALLGEQVCRTPEEFKAWSQNLGHDQVMTTFTSYGSVSSARQAEIMSRLANGDKPEEEDVSTLIAKLQRKIQERA